MCFFLVLLILPLPFSLMQLINLVLLFLPIITCLPTAPKPIDLPLQFIKRHSFQKRSSSLELPLLNDVGMSELGIQVKIGTPAKEFTLLFDTGSADTWVPSIRCLEINGCPEFLNRYNPIESHSSSQIINEVFNITYSIGGAAGLYFTDVLSLADGYTIQNQKLAMVESNRGAISHQRNKTVFLDGILGAGLPQGTIQYLQSGSGYDPVPVSLYESGLIPKPVFSVAIGQGDQGRVRFGDTMCPEGDLVYTPVAPAASHWAVNALGFQFKNKTTSRDFRFNQPTPVGIDTGSNFMYLPTALALDLAKTIAPGRFEALPGLFAVDCEYETSRDVLNLYFPGTQGQNVFISIPISKLVAKRESDGACFFLFTPSDHEFILGNMFLRHFVVVFDFGKTKQIGFAPLVDEERIMSVNETTAA